MSQLTREQVGEMVAQMENAICAYTYKSGIPQSDQDDVKQELRMNLCTAATRFDPARGVKWSSYAIKWILNWLRNRRATMGASYAECQSEDFEGFAAGRSSRFEDDDHNRHRVTDDEEEQDSPFVALSLGVKRSLAEPILALLSAKQRELVEAVVFDGFTVEQLADQWQQPVKVVRCNLKNTLRTMAEAGLVDHVMSDADAGRMLNKDQAPIRRNPDSLLSQRLERARSATDLERKRSASAAKALERANAHGELKRGFVMRRAAKHPAANAVLNALGSAVAGAVRDYLAGTCSFNDAAARVGLTPAGLGNKCRGFRKLAQHGYTLNTAPLTTAAVDTVEVREQLPDLPPVVEVVEVVEVEPVLTAEPASPPADTRPLLKRGYRDPAKHEAAECRKRSASLGAKHKQRAADFQRAAQHPNANAELFRLESDVRVALEGYLAGEWDFDQAADLVGLNTNAFGLRVQRFKALASGNARREPLTAAEYGRLALERQRYAIMQAAARHPAADATLAALGEETATAVRAYLAGSMTFNDAAESLGLSPCKLGHRLRPFRKLAAVEVPFPAPAVPERNSGDPIASVGLELTA